MIFFFITILSRCLSRFLIFIYYLALFATKFVILLKGDIFECLITKVEVGPTFHQQMLGDIWWWRISSKFEVCFFLELILWLVEAIIITMTDSKTLWPLMQDWWIDTSGVCYLVMVDMLWEELLIVEEFEICMKQFVVYYEIIFAFKLLNADGTTLLMHITSSNKIYIFSLVEPIVNTIVMEYMQTRKHSAKIAIFQLI